MVMTTTLRHNNGGDDVGEDNDDIQFDKRSIHRRAYQRTYACTWRPTNREETRDVLDRSRAKNH